MADEELEAIRRQRVAELQAKHGVRETEKETSEMSLFIAVNRTAHVRPLNMSQICLCNSHVLMDSRVSELNTEHKMLQRVIFMISVYDHKNTLVN